MFKNLAIATLFGILAIGLGAFGAHALKETLSEAELLSFETAVRYQMYHVIVLLVINGFEFLTPQQKNRMSYFFFAGIVLFSGSIYLIQLTEVTATSIWWVTPLGGLFFILGWSSLFMILIKKQLNKG